MVRRAYARRGIRYEPVSLEVIQRAWPTYRAPIEQQWGAYLDGKSTREDALDAILVALKK